jgi:hypothetical protein
MQKQQPQQQFQYKLTNTTVKPPKRDPKTGVDLRTMLEKVGHVVSFRGRNNESVMVGQNKSHILYELTEGIIGLQRGGHVSVERIDDVMTLLAQHTNKPAARATAPQAAVADNPMAKEPDSSEASDYAEIPSSERMASAIEMGLDDHKQKGGSEYEGATNPDGEPNFLVTASKKISRKARQR